MYILCAIGARARARDVLELSARRWRRPVYARAFRSPASRTARRWSRRRRDEGLGPFARTRSPPTAVDDRSVIFFFFFCSVAFARTPRRMQLCILYFVSHEIVSYWCTDDTGCTRKSTAILKINVRWTKSVWARFSPTDGDEERSVTKVFSGYLNTKRVSFQKPIFVVALQNDGNVMKTRFIR